MVTKNYKVTKNPLDTGANAGKKNWIFGLILSIYVLVANKIHEKLRILKSAQSTKFDAEE